MALVASSGPIKHTKVNSGDVRLRKSEVIVLDVLMKNEATYKHWHVGHHESYYLGKDHPSKNTVVTSSPVNARQRQCIT